MDPVGNVILTVSLVLIVSERVTENRRVTFLLTERIEVVVYGPMLTVRVLAVSPVTALEQVSRKYPPVIVEIVIMSYMEDVVGGLINPEIYHPN